MKRIIILLAGICMAFTGLAQDDSTKKQEADTIRVGNMIIIKKAGHDQEDKQYRNERQETRSYRRNHSKPKNLETNWGIVDLGFANYNDQTKYGSPEAISIAGNLVKSDFKLITGKSSNVNVWVVMQRLNVIKHVVNLKYGVGFESINYRYKRPLKFDTDPTFIRKDVDRDYEKNKLVTEYITVPMMLNFNFTPKRDKGFGFSVGASAGYLYASRQKTITAEDGKQKKRDDFDLRPWRIAYIGELSLGPVILYGTYAKESMFERGLDQRPYTVGLRLSNW
jgi:Outer membrane protein beta-barrel domain